MDSREIFEQAFSQTKESYKSWILDNYPKVWEKVTSELTGTGDDSGNVWLLEAANYLFKTNGVCWTVDPAYSSYHVPTPNSVANAFPSVDLILLTHSHADHFDAKLLQQFCLRKNLVIAVPDFLEDLFRAVVDPADCDVRIVGPEEQVAVGPLTARAFTSLHLEIPPDGGETIGVPEMGWMVEIEGRRILMPGDIRANHFERLPCFGKIDWLFAHIWLGRNKSMNFTLADLERYCRFMAGFDAKNIFLGHVHEVTRNHENYWSFIHAGLVMDKLMELKPETRTLTARAGQNVVLWQ